MSEIPPRATRPAFVQSRAGDLKTPPLVHEQTTTAQELGSERDPRFLLFVGLVVAALSIGLKSELLTARRVWALSIVLAAVALPALVLYLREEHGLPAIEHYIPTILGLIALTGLSFIVPEWWKYLLAATGFACTFFLAGYFDYERAHAKEKPGHVVLQEAVLGVITVAAYLVILTSQVNLLFRLVAIFGITWLATFRSFRILGRPIPSRRAFFFSLLVAQVVAFLSWAMSVYVLIGEGLFAGMLLLAWYINRGVIRHAVEETLNRRVALEFGALSLFLAYLFFTNYQPPAT